MKYDLSKALGSTSSQWISLLVVMCLFLSITNLYLIHSVVNNTIIIERSPFSTYKNVRITRFTGDRNFREVWGLSTAKLLGNAAPRESKYILNTLSSMATSSVYTQMKMEITERFSEMAISGIEIYWRPEGEIFHDMKNNQVTVQGYRTLKNITTGEEDIRPYVYKFVIESFDYGPYIKGYEHGYVEGLK